MIECPRCFSKNIYTDKFCVECGHEIPTGKHHEVDQSGLVTGYAKCNSPENHDCSFKTQTYQNVYDGLFTETEMAREVARLNQLLNPMMWTAEMHDAWHKNIPNVQAAFDALREVSA